MLAQEQNYMWLFPSRKYYLMPHHFKTLDPIHA